MGALGVLDTRCVLPTAVHMLEYINLSRQVRFLKDPKPTPIEVNGLTHLNRRLCHYWQLIDTCKGTRHSLVLSIICLHWDNEEVTEYMEIYLFSRSVSEWYIESLCQHC